MNGNGNGNGNVSGNVNDPAHAQELLVHHNHNSVMQQQQQQHHEPDHTHARTHIGTVNGKEEQVMGVNTVPEMVVNVGVGVNVGMQVQVPNDGCVLVTLLMGIDIVHHRVGCFAEWEGYYRRYVECCCHFFGYYSLFGIIERVADDFI